MPTPINDQDTRQMTLQNTTDTGRPPRRRLATPEAAYNIFTKQFDDSAEEAKRRATIQGMIDGNPPYSQKEMDELGLGHLCNVNFMTMRANLDARAGAAHELFFEVPTLIEARPRSAALAGPETYEWCRIISEEFSSIVLEWDGFLPAMDLVVRESDAYGLGYVLFPNEWDWRPKAFRRGTLLFDPQARVEVDRNELYMIRDEYTAGELFDIVEDEEAAKLRGWNVSHVRATLVKVFIIGENGDKQDPYSTSLWESVQQMARNSELAFQEKQFEKVKIVHFLVKEVAGDQKVSHYIIPERSADHVFLYEGHDKYDRMSEALWWLPYNYGDGYARSVRGVASHMVQHDDLSNRFLCRVFDAGFLSSSLLLQPQSPTDGSTLQFTEHGPITVLPAEMKAVQSTFQPQMTPLLQLRQVSEEVMKNNTGTYRQHGETMGRDTPKTARQVIEETSKEARYEKAAIAHRYNVLDKLYREMFRRMADKDYQQSKQEYSGKKEAELFFQRCVDRGVDPNFIYEWAENVQIFATRAIGMGSTSARYDVTQQVLAASGSFPSEQGKLSALRDWLAARVGNWNVDRYVPRNTNQHLEGSEASLSMLEWNDILEGSQTLVTADQMHKPHIEVFVPRMAQVIQMVEQGQTQDPMKDYRTMSLAIPHVQQHVDYLRSDQRREAYVKQVDDFLKVANQALTKLKTWAQKVMRQQQKMAQEQQQKMAQADQVVKDRELEAKIMEIRQKYDLERLKQESLNDARREKTEEQLQIRREGAAAETQLKAEKQAAELRMKAAEQAAEMAMKRNES